MKRGSQYAKRVKRLFQQMVHRFGKPQVPEPSDPIQQLVIAILAECTLESKAATVFKRVVEQMVDLNELRVTPAMELAGMISEALPLAREKADRIVRVLNEVRLRQDTLDLSFLKQRGKREAREYLESLDGAGLAAAASVVAYSLGGHAIPVDYLTMYVLRKDEVVEPSATQAEVQAFLERHVPAADCQQFAILLNKYAAGHASRVPLAKLPELLNLEPPAPPKPQKRSAISLSASAALPVVDDGGAGEPDQGDLGEVEAALIADSVPASIRAGSAKSKKAGAAAAAAAKATMKKPAAKSIGAKTTSQPAKNHSSVAKKK